MKPISISLVEHYSARQDARPPRCPPLPITDFCFRPQPDVPLGHAHDLPGHRARHAFRRMTAEMLTKHERDEPVELAIYAFVTAIALWPLIDLLIVLAQTANG